MPMVKIPMEMGKKINQVLRSAFAAQHEHTKHLDIIIC
jgi:hypothetical protein